MLKTLWGITAPSLQAYSNETTSNKQKQTHTKWKWGTLASSEGPEKGVVLLLLICMANNSKTAFNRASLQ